MGKKLLTKPRNQPKPKTESKELFAPILKKIFQLSRHCRNQGPFAIGLQRKNDVMVNNEEDKEEKKKPATSCGIDYNRVVDDIVNGLGAVDVSELEIFPLVPVVGQGLQGLQESTTRLLPQLADPPVPEQQQALSKQAEDNSPRDNSGIPLYPPDISKDLDEWWLEVVPLHEGADQQEVEPMNLQLDVFLTGFEGLLEALTMDDGEGLNLFTPEDMTDSAPALTSEFSMMDTK